MTTEFLTGFFFEAIKTAILLAAPVLQHHYRLGNVVTVVDAVNGERQLDTTPEAVKQAASLQPEVVLLPDEPYRFAQPDADEIAALDVPAAREGRVHLIDGTWVSWYGPRIRRALETCRAFLHPGATE